MKIRLFEKVSVEFVDGKVLLVNNNAFGLVLTARSLDDDKQAKIRFTLNPNASLNLKEILAGAYSIKFWKVLSNLLQTTIHDLLDDRTSRHAELMKLQARDADYVHEITV